jgi:hypothetical protein
MALPNASIPLQMVDRTGVEPGTRLVVCERLGGGTVDPDWRGARPAAGPAGC